MHPPGAICRQLYQIHPQLRLAWHGYARENEDDLNAGSFALVQLYHRQDAGKHGQENTYFTLWNPPGFHLGPIFDRNGGGRIDWDPLTRVPVYAANLVEFGIPIEDVFSGAFLRVVREWLVPIGRRLREDARQKNLDLNSKVADISDEATKFLWREANKPDAVSITSANKHNREAMKAWERQKEQAEKLNNHFHHTGM